MLKKIILAISAVTVLIALSYALFLFATEAYSSFRGATDTVKAAIIGALVSMVALFLGRYFEQKREVKQRINAEKIVIYKAFFDFYFDLFSYEKVHGKPKPENEVVGDMLEFQKNLVLWAPDAVIKAYLEFKRVLAQNAEGLSEGEELHRNLASTMEAVAKLLTAMRRDLGYSFTSFSTRDLASLQLADDPETQKIFVHIK